MSYAISRQMSLHEMYTIHLGGQEEDDQDPYEERRDHLYTITEHKIQDLDSSSGDDADDEDIEDRL